MEELITESKIVVENMIYEVRGKQVMLDSDLAELYQVETKRINEAVKNNFEKFPERFSWVPSNDDWTFLRSKISTLKIKTSGRGAHRKYMPRVFTEQGVAMLATILRSKVATEVSIKIMDAFVMMHKYISTNLLEQKYINNQVMQNTKDIKLLQESFKKFDEKRKSTEIYFNGQIWDAYSKILDIFKEAKTNLVIVDAYADNTLLDIIKRLSINVILITKPNNLITNQDILKYNEQYHNLTIKFDNTFHDRYFILDKKVIYHCGASINRIGYKTFSITLISDKEVSKLLINNVYGII